MTPGPVSPFSRTSAHGTAARPTPPLRVLLGHVLRRHRSAQHRTLADVAREAQVSTQYLSELERGRKEASSEVLAALCRALHLDLTDLLAEVREDVLVLRSTSPAQGSRVVGIGSRQSSHAVHPSTGQPSTGQPSRSQPYLRAA